MATDWPPFVFEMLGDFVKKMGHVKRGIGKTQDNAAPHHSASKLEWGLGECFEFLFPTISLF